MLPRTDGDAYKCRTNVQLRGAGSCRMPHQKREAVDRAVLAMFESWFLDLDATRDGVARHLSARLDEITAQSARAERDVSQTEAQLARIERDYLTETLSAATYERFRERVEAELATATAERDRLAAHAAVVRNNWTRLDAEAETLHRLAGLREAVLKRKRTAEEAADIEALRAALAQTCEAINLREDAFIDSCEPRVDLSEPLSGDTWDEILNRPVHFPPRTTQHGTLVS